MQHIPLPLKLAFAWLWVAVPLGWGVCQSAIKSAPLFGMGDEIATVDRLPARSQEAGKASHVQADSNLKK